VTILIGSDIPEVVELGDLLGADLIRLPTLPLDPDWSWAPALEEWREAAAASPQVDHVVVAAWGGVNREPSFADLDEARWLVDGEQRLAIWAAAFGAAVRRCADGGAVVAVIDRPHVLDSASHTMLLMVADGVENLVRSMARAEGSRGVRINALTSSSRLTPLSDMLAPAPLPGHPGTIRQHVAPLVSQLLLPDTAGLSGRVIDVDFGRSWR
jgi:NAD(P)-dependent dehydrogenase (short-subunit alcohol dehydrogenase family)